MKQSTLLNATQPFLTGELVHPYEYHPDVSVSRLRGFYQMFSFLLYGILHTKKTLARCRIMQSYDVKLSNCLRGIRQNHWAIKYKAM